MGGGRLLTGSDWREGSTVSSPRKVGSLSCWPEGGSSDGVGWNVWLGGGVWGRWVGGGALVLGLCRGNCSSDQVESVSGASGKGKKYSMDCENRYVVLPGKSGVYWSLSLTQESSYVHPSSQTAWQTLAYLQLSTSCTISYTNGHIHFMSFTVPNVRTSS